MSVGRKIPRQEMLPWADVCVDSLSKHFDVFLCGSIRRGMAMVGDIDLVVVGNGSPFRVLEGQLPDLRMADEDMQSLAGVRECMSFALPNRSFVGFIDVWHATSDAIGAGVMYATGSGLTNVLMRRWARSRGKDLRFQGVFCGGDLIASKTEAEVFSALGWEYVPPEERNPGSPIIDRYIAALGDFAD